MQAGLKQTQYQLFNKKMFKLKHFFHFVFLFIRFVHLHASNYSKKMINFFFLTKNCQGQNKPLKAILCVCKKWNFGLQLALSPQLKCCQTPEGLKNYPITFTLITRQNTMRLIWSMFNVKYDEILNINNLKCFGFLLNYIISYGTILKNSFQI